MPLYEHVFLARQDLSQAQVDALAASATEIVEQGGGKVSKTETWGLKSLAYKIDRNRKAHFVLLNIEGPGSEAARSLSQTKFKLRHYRSLARVAIRPETCMCAASRDPELVEGPREIPKKAGGAPPFGRISQRSAWK